MLQDVTEIGCRKATVWSLTSLIIQNVTEIGCRKGAYPENSHVVFCNNKLNSVLLNFVCVRIAG